MADHVHALGYVRVSTDEQARSGLGLEAQRRALRAEARRHGWQLEIVVEDGRSAKDLNRPVLQDALDRLSRSVADFGTLLRRADKRGWSVVCLDLGVDTATPSGELFANVVASMSQYERRLIGQRTRDALAEKRAQGVRLGRPPVLPVEVVERIVREQRTGQSLGSIAAGLEQDGVPTARGGAWSRASVQSVLRSQAAAAVA